MTAMVTEIHHRTQQENRELKIEIERLRSALIEAEACMTIVAPRNNTAVDVRILGVVRAAIKAAEK